MLENQEPLLIDNIHADTRYKPLGHDSQTVLQVPVLLNEAVVAILNIESDRIYAFDDGDVRLFTSIAAELGIALRNARLFEQIRAAEASYHDLFDNANDFIITLDSNFRIVSANKVTLRTTGYELDELFGAKITDFLPPSQFPKLRHVLRHQLSVHKDTQPFVLVMVGKNRQTLWLETTIRVRRQGKRPVGIQCIARDITKRRELERELKQTEKLSAIGKLVAGVAHELNNPLATVIGYSSLLRENDLTPEHMADIEVIFRQAQRARTIVRDLLTFARRLDLRRTATDLNQAVQNSLRHLQPQLNAENVTVTTRLDGHLPITMADGQQLEQVFENLIQNAIHATQGQGLTAELMITSQFRHEGTLQLSFSNSGPHIPPNIINRVFEPFFTTKQPGAGTGLGLSICFGIISGHGGRIWVENQAPHGVAFHIELPWEQPEPIVLEPITPSVEPPVTQNGHHALNLLVVDDEVHIVDLLRRLLSRSGFQIDTAANGRIGLDKLTKRAYDLVVCDVIMPDMSGIELFDCATQNQSALKERFIFITGNASDPNVRDFLEKNQLPWLAKPFLPSELHKIIGSRLKNK